VARCPRLASLAVVKLAKRRAAAPRKPVIMVSSAVYHLEALLDQVFGTLEGFGYKVWMSHKGTIPQNHRLSALDNCIEAVNTCDLFLCIITGRYGSGREGADLAITHRELLQAIARDKPRWFLVHHDVVVARQLLKQLRFDAHGQPTGFVLKSTPVIQDIRVIEMYEAAMREDLPLAERTANWVQEFMTPDDVLRYLDAQFADVDRLERVLKS
jgi:Domain of unknown function (DUF4062)